MLPSYPRSMGKPKWLHSRMATKLFYGDNIEILRRKIKDETIDLCYIDPPFNSKRNYNQIYNNIGSEDRAQAQAFTDTWTWDDHAIDGYNEIIANDKGRFQPHLIDLIKGLQPVLGHGSLLAYLVHIALRVTEIHRVLKPTGTLFLHCDPTASHYIRIVLDAVFCGRQGGDFINEIVWCYRQGGRSNTKFPKKHDTIFWYSKGSTWTFNGDPLRVPYEGTGGFQTSGKGVTNKASGKTYFPNPKGKIPEDWWDIPALPPMSAERLGYPTQKPEALLERIINVSTDEGDLVLDAYCGCGTTVFVAHGLKRNWIGMDITFQSIALILKRLEDAYGSTVSNAVILDGVPKDMASATALAHKRDDRLRKEFEKWAVLTYTSNRAIINEKKGGDQGIDGTAFFLKDKDRNGKIVFQVKSGAVGRGDISKLNNDRTREGADIGVMLTLNPITAGMTKEANAAGRFEHKLMNRNYDHIRIVTIQDMIEKGARLEIPMSLEVMKAAEKAADKGQITLI